MLRKGNKTSDNQCLLDLFVMLIMIPNFIYLKCTICECENFYDVSNRKPTFIYGSNRENPCNRYRMSSFKSLTQPKFVDASNRSLNVGQFSTTILSYSNSMFDRNASKYLDTLTYDDIVRNQYALLPYPAVSPDLIANERHYYIHNRDRWKKPFYFVFADALESMNHFLFKGSNNFR